MIAVTVSPSIEAAQKWAAMDPNPTTARYTLDLVTEASSSDCSDASSLSALVSLESLFPSDERQRIGFGTAGLRSEMKPGPLGMNDLTVCQAAQGLARYYLKKQQHQSMSQGTTTQPEKLCAVVGYDHRSHPTLNISSLSFAILTAIIFAEAGIDCMLLHNFAMTPLVPFAIQKLSAVCGVMVTASHNPYHDNGYKVYDSDACQIRSPTDSAIASEIVSNLKPWKDYRSIIEERQTQYPNDPCLGLSNEGATSELLEDYFEALEKSGLRTNMAGLSSLTGQGSSTESRTPPAFAYTAMHGIGYPFAKRAFETFELPPFQAVPAQRDPDPSFPTVSFPNPEEKGALDLAKAFAEAQNCDIVLANDPDADRLAVAEKDRSTGSWTVFSGDQIGTMLGLWLWERIGKHSDKPVSMCISTVSSKMLVEIGKREGFHVEESLTGFKWIGSRSAELKAEGYHHLFGYEEAIGYACGDVVFDKDGVSAMVVLSELALHLYIEKGITLKVHMDNLYSKYGFFCSRNGYYSMSDPSRAQTILDHLRSGNTLYSKLNESVQRSGRSVRSIRDHLGRTTPGLDSTKHRPPVPDGSKHTKPIMSTVSSQKSSAPLLSISLSSGCLVQLRPSGTEPKFKYYLEMQGTPGMSRQTVREELDFCESVLLDQLLKPTENGLTKTQ